MPRRYLGSFITYNPVEPTAQAASGMWPLNQQLQERAAGTWPLAFGDPYFNYTTLLLSSTSLSNANNNLFVDSSGAFNPISRNGNTTQGSFTPYGSYWSNYFDGSGDYLTAPSNAAFDILSGGDFTVEAWVYFNSIADNSGYGAAIMGRTAGSGDGWIFRCRPTAIEFVYPGLSANSTSFTFTAGQWYHIVAQRNGSTLYYYVNGTRYTPTYSNRTTDASAQTMVIGRSGNDSGGTYAYVNGYISNARIVKGTAVYTSNFTPPAYPLTAVSGTSLLTCQSSRFIDNSTNAFTITVNGNTSVTNFAPFLHTAPIAYNQSDITNWSGYFDGSGDYLQVPNNAALGVPTGDFTFETWVYPTALTGQNYTPIAIYAINNVSVASDLGYACIIKSNNTVEFSVYVGSTAYRATSTSTISANTWTHVAGVRSGNTLTLYLNGTSAATVTISGTINDSTNPVYRIGGYQETSTFYYFTGYISNQRLVKGTAVYTGNFTPPTSPLTAISGTSLLTLQNAAFTDNSTNNFVITPNGNVTVTGNSPFNTVGYWSNYFDGTGDYLYTPTNAAFGVGAGDFTVEAWIFPTGAWTSGGFNCLLQIDGTGIYFGQNSGGFGLRQSGTANIISYGTSPTLNTWTHVAIVRSGTTVTMYYNGVSVATATSSANFSSGNAWVGSDATPGNYYAGYISNLRLVKGTAVYTSNFTVPTAPLTAITNTSLLTCQNGRFIDNSTNNFTITRNGDVSVQSFDPFYTSTIASNGGSMYFDGSGDYLSAANNVAFGFRTGDYTVEFWLYLAALPPSGKYTLVDFRTASNAQPHTMYVTSTGYMGFFNGSSDVTSSSQPITAGTWAHIAYSRSSGTLQIYVNGVQAYSAANTIDYQSSRPLTLGAAVGGIEGLNGYIAGFRITKSALYTTAFTPPTAPVTPTPNTALLVNGMNAGIYDATAINDMETIGNAQVTTAVSKYGGSSVYFDGSGDGLKFPSNVAMAMGTGNFTWELWVRATAASGYQSLIDTRTAVLTDGFFFGLDTGTLRPAVFTNGTVLVSSTSLTANTWQHLALVRSSGTLTIYLDGTSIGSVANSTNLTSGVGTIGSSDFIANPNWFNGYIDDLRITNGVARYTSNFTPPTAALPTF